METAYVAGAAGAIGRHCVAQLRALGWVVGGIGHGPVLWPDIGGIDAWVAGDVAQEGLDLLKARLGPPTLFINLAGGSSVGPSLSMPLGDFERTVAASVQIFNWLARHAPNALLSLASSAAVYGAGRDGPIPEDAPTAPISPYGHHKLMMEENARFWGRAFGVKSSIVRLFSVYGSGLRKQLVHDLCGRLAAEPEVLSLSGTGNETRDWLWIGDAARIMIEVGLRASAEVPVFNGCTGVAHSTADLARLLVTTWGGDVEIRFDGIVRPGDPAHLEGDAERLHAAGIHANRTLEDGLAETIAVWRGNKVQ